MVGERVVSVSEAFYRSNTGGDVYSRVIHREKSLRNDVRRANGVKWNQKVD
jgi:hypothetical protein